jgi:RsmE family RNA methyltransferase
VNLILIDHSEIGAEGLVRMTGARATHIRHVLRATVGDDVRVGVIEGPRGVGTVAAIDDDAVVVRCVCEVEIPPRPAVDLLLAVPRPKVLRRLWAQLAAMGIGRIMLTNAERVERDYFGTHLLDESAYRPLLIEGLQQARDTRVPQVSVHRRFKVLVEDHLDALCPDAVRLAAQPGAGMPVSRVLAGSEDPALHRDSARQRVLLAVGPEGGWNDFELKLLDAHGFHPVDMGARPLRSDTACLALLALVHDALRRLSPGPSR